ncbi:hypothetical protein SAMN05443287_111142 [Micromonospora phaseoli]|uniref:Clumping factor A n=1 Tax=Micromonospora phaseoli TaxID=1144548 RepID=A0A1H7D1X5_9ACTN|nr:hypothetical protein [Micromonospora phaseoli]PZV98127.1 hypothetical protein CLV64_105395 [Micromonospora phaseoli]GIJ77762.1 hypothetical protein Xph01_21940 [Micromonospora phaseoli]SEJ95878.1 hypothetical protein SAMN05443287_111142 [Micromonospora phaseoli]
MIVISLALILVAVVLLVLGLAGGSSALLVISIAASLLAAVALVTGARQAAAGRAPTQDGAPVGQPAEPAGPAAPVGREPGIPPQYAPATVDTGDAGWRQPPGSPVADLRERPADGYDDEPAAQEITADQAALVAGLADEVRVIDGRPRYHLDECPHLVGREHEPLPVAEAVDLGFTPCAHCTPDTILLSESGRR